MIYIFLADGFEECEALIPVDILRRANIEIKTVGINSSTVTGSHKIPVVADIGEAETILDNNLKGIILPGGMPGTLNLENSQTVQKAIDFSINNNLLIGAICAAPMILGHKNLLNQKTATCFTGFEKELYGANVSDCQVVRDGNIITACGAGVAFEFGFEILSYLKSDEEAEILKKQMKYSN